MAINDSAVDGIVSGMECLKIEMMVWVGWVVENGCLKIK